MSGEELYAGVAVVAACPIVGEYGLGDRGLPAFVLDQESFQSGARPVQIGEDQLIYFLPMVLRDVANTVHAQADNVGWVVDLDFDAGFGEDDERFARQHRCGGASREYWLQYPYSPPSSHIIYAVDTVHVLNPIGHALPVL